MSGSLPPWSTLTLTRYIRVGNGTVPPRKRPGNGNQPPFFLPLCGRGEHSSREPMGVDAQVRIFSPGSPLGRVPVSVSWDVLPCTGRPASGLPDSRCQHRGRLQGLPGREPPIREEGGVFGMRIGANMFVVACPAPKAGILSRVRFRRSSFRHCAPVNPDRDLPLKKPGEIGLVLLLEFTGPAAGSCTVPAHRRSCPPGSCVPWTCRLLLRTFP